MYPDSIQNLIDQFSKFPTVGPRTASRFVFYLMNLPQKETEKLIKLILDLKKRIYLCKFCFNPFEISQAKESLCKICSDPSRDRTLLCVIEKEQDLISIEKTKKYKGLYFILGGTAPTLKKSDFEKLRIKELKARIFTPQKFGILDASFKEIILATNPTTEGEATALYLERILKPFGIKITRLGRGIPIGGELEYADEETLAEALERRK